MAYSVPIRCRQVATYDSDLTGGSLQVRESRIIADLLLLLLLRGASPEQWQEAIQRQNLLQKRSPASAKRIAQALRKRLDPAGLIPLLI